MRKQLLILLVALVGMAVQGMAQGPFTVKKIPFTKFVKLTAQGVNLRKAPSTTSPRLIYEENEMGDFYAEWSSGKLRQGQEVAHATVLPVNGEKGEWYQGAFEGQTVYVMKKFCKDIALRPLPTGGADNGYISSGKYKGYCISMEESYGGFSMRIGQYVDGMFVYNYQAWANAYNEGATTIDKENGVNFSKRYADEFGNPSLKKILADSKLLDMLMGSTSKMNYSPVAYYGIVGDDQVYSISWEQ